MLDYLMFVVGSNVLKKEFQLKYEDSDDNVIGDDIIDDNDINNSDSN
ncbi:19133_t:CDS:2 [Funneliformis geosporum]|nr:19133_t:CDS:2 [Funneliformis geosporum]